jgi:hypothetical protein
MNGTLFDLGAPVAPAPKRRAPRVTAPLLPGIVQFGGAAAERVITITRGPRVWVATFSPPAGGIETLGTAYDSTLPAREVAAAVSANWPGWRVEVSL